MHWPWQLAPQFALHDAVHSDEFASEAHWPWQLPEQSASHEPSQLKLPGLAVQLPLQFASQLPVHDALAVAVHPPLHDAWSDAAHEAWKLIGVQSAVHPPDVTIWHCASAVMSTFPQSERTSARATRGADPIASAARARTRVGTRRRSVI